MNLEEHFKNYPFLKKAFWPCADEIKYQVDHPHPLIFLILDKGAETTEVANRTDKCIQSVSRINQNWLKGKVKTILNDVDFSNVSAALGEIRAFGELIWIKKENVIVGKSGSDFNFKADGITVHIEVAAPQHRTKRHTMEHEALETDSIKWKMEEIFSFGWPERNIDNVQGEAVSKIASIKQEEYQFQKDAINILWVDLKDPTLWQEFGREQFLPISAFREEITSGAFWNAFYAKRGTYIYDDLSVQGLPSKIYEMEFNGRFWNESLVDIVIADTRTDQIAFQNPNRDMNIPDELFRSIHCLFAFNLELSWLDWPIKGSLLKRVKIELERIQKYKDAFQID